MPMKPTGYFVLLRLDEDTIDKELGKKTKGGYTRDSGLFIPENTETVNDVFREKAAQEYGTIVDIGPIAWYDYADGRPWAKAGDRVCFSKYAGKFIKDPDTDEALVLLLDSDIVGIIETKKEEVDTNVE